jgi:5,6-dimethylbenzimidazole synthase
LKIPDHIVPVAYLCLGYVEAFAAEPDLERAGWEKRIPLGNVLALDQYDKKWDAKRPTP